MNDVAVVVACIEDIVVRVDENFGFAGNPDLQCNQKQSLLLVKNHANILELQALKLALLQWNLIQLVLGTRLVVVHPDTALLENINYLELIASILVLVNLVA